MESQDVKDWKQPRLCGVGAFPNRANALRNRRQRKMGVSETWVLLPRDRRGPGWKHSETSVQQVWRAKDPRSAPLLEMQEMRVPNGPPLPLDRQLRWLPDDQIVLPVLVLRVLHLRDRHCHGLPSCQQTKYPLHLFHLVPKAPPGCSYSSYNSNQRHVCVSRREYFFKC